MMQFRHMKTVITPTDLINGRFDKKVQSMAWSPNGYRLAIALADNWVYLFDDNGELQDKFPTKQADKSLNKPYSIRKIEFSPDSTKLAVAQSDDIVFVYKLGATWDEKKTICNKFYQQSPNELAPDRAVTAMCWPRQRHHELVFGLVNGQVKQGLLKQNKSSLLYEPSSPVLSMASSPDGHSFVSGHLDGSIYKYTFPSGNQIGSTSSLLVKLSFAPYCLGWGDTILAAGLSNRVQSIDPSTARVSDVSLDPSITEVISLSVSPSGSTAILGSYDRFDVLVYNGAKHQWDVGRKENKVEHLLSVTALEWSPDGSKLVTGSLGGAVDIYDSCLKRSLYKGQYEFVYTSLSCVVVKKIATGAKVTLSSRFGCEILKINVYLDRYLIANTPDTLIAADLQRGLVSEVRANIPVSLDNDNQPSSSMSSAESKSSSSSSGDGQSNITERPKYYFDNEDACLVFYGGELFVIEYGVNDIIGSVRTEHVSPHVVSLVLNNSLTSSSTSSTSASSSSLSSPAFGVSTTPAGVRRLAYLIDSQVIRIVELASASAAAATGRGVEIGGQGAFTVLATIAHDHKVDWLELNPAGTKLLFRDKRRSLQLFDVPSQTRTTLLTFCSYVQWVPQSDVVVAQGKNTLNVWYNIDVPADVSAVPLKGDVVEIERVPGRTDVIVDEGIHKLRYPLNEGLISFGSAVRAGDIRGAAAILESLPSTTSSSSSLSTLPPSGQGTGLTGGATVESMWSTLAQLALERLDLVVAQQAFAALQDPAKSAYIERIIELVNDSAISSANGSSSSSGSGSDGMLNDGSEEALFKLRNNPHVKAMIAAVNRQFNTAQSAYLEQGMTTEAIELYKSMHKWDEAMSIAISRSHPQRQKLQQEYFDFLVATKQEERAAEAKDQQGDTQGALRLYLKGGFPTRAAALISRERLFSDTLLCDSVSDALLKSKNYEQAGDFFAARGMNQRALDAYRQGKFYSKAVELCRKTFPAQLVELQEEWGQYLFKNRHFDAACAKFEDAHNHMMAATAAIESKQWVKASKIAAQLGPQDARTVYRWIALHYTKTRQYAEAEKTYLDGGMAADAANMYVQAGMYGNALTIAKTYLRPHELTQQFGQHAVILEEQGKLKEAEKLYVGIGDIDRAIDMYKKNKQYDEMVRLVKQHRPALVVNTHLLIASILEKEGNCKSSELHYVDAGEWEMAVRMYQERDMWDDSLRVAKDNGGSVAYSRAAYKYAKTVGGEQGVRYLMQNGLAEQAVDMATAAMEWDYAFNISELSCKHKLPHVHEQYAMAMEDEGRFAEAERAFLLAGKPKEAIDMHIHCKDWAAATRVAEMHAPSALLDITIARAKAAAIEGSFPAAETLYVQAKQPLQAIAMYRDANMWEDAIRLATQYAPKDVAVLQAQRLSGMASTGNTNTVDYIVSQARLYEQQRQYGAAVDGYLRLTKQHIPDRNSLVNNWLHALELAEDYLPARRVEIGQTVASRMNEQLGMVAEAADVLARVGSVIEAIKMLAAAGKFDHADRIARANGPEAVRLSEQLRQDTLVKTGQLDELQTRNVDLAADVYAQTGQWDRLLEIARKQGPQAVAKYSINHAAALAKEGKFRAALDVLHKHGCAPSATSFPVLLRIAQEVLMRSEEPPEAKSASAQAANASAESTAYAQLKAVLFKYQSDLSGAGAAAAADLSADQLRILDRMLLITHFIVSRDTARSAGLMNVAARLSMALLRYVHDIPADKAFLDAGKDARTNTPSSTHDRDREGWYTNSIIFLNRFMDLYDAIEDPSFGNITNAEFEGTDIPSPDSFPLPKRPCTGSSEYDEIRGWVLDHVIDASSNQKLSTRSCDNCSRSVYTAALSCSQCRTNFEPCRVSGFPISKNASVSCTSCRKPANRQEFNEWVDKFKTCPWCSSPQRPQY